MKFLFVPDQSFGLCALPRERRGFSAQAPSIAADFPGFTDDAMTGNEQCDVVLADSRTDAAACLGRSGHFCELAVRHDLARRYRN